METKRCQRCHKLLRAEAQTCSRCGGYDFLPASQIKPRNTGVLLSSETNTASFHPDRTTSRVGSPLSPLPPTQLSPHRAGHYSGLHPEDEPYQSSFLPVQRLPLTEQPALEVEEVEDLAYSTVPDMPGVPAPTSVSVPPKRQVASLAPLPAPRQQRSVQTIRLSSPPQMGTERDQGTVRAYAEAATMAGPRPRSLPPRRPERKQKSVAVRLLFIISIFLFVVATGILAFLFIDGQPPVTLKPQLTPASAGSLRVSDTLLVYGSRFEANAPVTITRDANIAVLKTHTFSTGNFVVSIPIGKDWSVGPHVIYATDQQGHQAQISISVQPTPPYPPLLQLSLNHIDMGENRAGVVSLKTITLTNAGGSDVNWQGSSDAPAWLKLTPPGGRFAGRQDVVITVDRGNLEPKPYSGHISFTQLDSNKPALVLTVTMGVNPPSANPAAANLVISNAAFAFSGDPVTNPAVQTITIQNTGGQGLNWTASASTTSGNWLALSSSGGYLAGGATSTMTVIATSAGLTAGTYQGTITFSYAGGSATPVTVTLTVNPPPVAKIALSSGGLSFHTIMGQNPAAQSFTITNTGNAPLNWGILEDGNGKTYAPVSQSSGTLAPSKSVVIAVIPSIGQAGAGTLNALITVIDTDGGQAVKSQQVRVTFTIVSQAIISLDQYQLTFNHTSAIPNSTELLTVTNTGSAPLNWSLTISNPSTVPWLSVDTSGGTGLQPGGVDFINVQCNTTKLSPGTYTATLTLRDTASVNPAPPQTVTVTAVVS